MPRPLNREVSYPDGGPMSLEVTVNVLASSAEAYGATDIFVEIDGERRPITAVLFESRGNKVVLIGDPKSE